MREFLVSRQCTGGFKMKVGVGLRKGAAVPAARMGVGRFKLFKDVLGRVVIYGPGVWASSLLAKSTA